ncbi:Serine/threonine-protein kinase PrkC [Stieleria maiorica]|uniref:Serine/threonine-protein kinase PrkC n=1 Tax=Stieleria maiorica TaxID=2795974 RepID=A0A5B9MQJ3_9BACT|nr:serine/threonine-protein kinase [Stieleria maiorica]QEG02105.1 Serine/threonine-protein kinase PrkC [Stieleria maiorica]
MSVETTVPEPVLDEATRDFVRRSMQAGLVELADIKKVVVSLMTEDVVFTPDRLAQGMVGADLLTPWQAKKLLAGKARGFHLGNYRLLRPLGRGGMGVVFLARHAVMNRLMALKILPSEASKDSRRIERFKEEARASAKLEHPNIVQAFDFSESDGKLFIVMEYIEGVDLHRAVARDGVMSPTEALDAMIQTTDALAHAHQRGIVHRDIKPSNLLLRNDGVIKVSDMGLARIGYTAAGTDAPNRLTGTADFIAPEQAIDSHTVDARADIYSLGCTWYFLLVGKPPFSGNNVAQRLAKHQTAKVPLVSDTRSDCPPAISLLIQRMMAKRPVDRPASAAELLTQLRRIAGSKLAGRELANRPRSEQIATPPDDSSSFASLDDSGPLGEASPAAMAEIAEIDFGSLPPIDLATLPGAAVPVSPLAAPSNAATKTTTPKTKRTGGDVESGQSILLGIGLALSIVALLAVVGVTFYQVTKDDKASPRLKTMEDGKGNVIVIEQ